MGERKIVGEYTYTDEHGNRLFQVVRFDPKDFAARHKHGGGWAWGMGGVQPTIYNLHAVHVHQSQPVIVVEGERKADALKALGLIGTCNPFGAGKWLPDFGRWLRGRRVAVLPDNDPPGHAHACLVAGNLMFHGAASIRVVHLPGLPDGGDVVDWLADGPVARTPEQKRRALCEYIRAAPEWVQVHAREAAAA